MHTRTPARRLEVIGLLVVLAALAAQLVTAGSLMPYSDPANWFAFGRNFTEQFGDKRLAYGFPLLVAVAIQVVGPFYAFLINVGWKRRLTVRSGGRRLYDSVLTQGARSTRRADYKKRIVFSAPPGVVAADDTRLHWSLGAPVADASDPARLWIRINVTSAPVRHAQVHRDASSLTRTSGHQPDWPTPL